MTCATYRIESGDGETTGSVKVSVVQGKNSDDPVMQGRGTNIIIRRLFFLPLDR